MPFFEVGPDGRAAQPACFPWLTRSPLYRLEPRSSSATSKTPSSASLVSFFPLLTHPNVAADPCLLPCTVRDSALREKDPILGIVNLPLKKLFAEASEVTRMFSLEEGQGFGRVNISLLFRPLKVDLPPVRPCSVCALLSLVWR
jgi:hypothetical protein